MSALIGGATVAATLVFVVTAYKRHWSWTGFAGDARKTLWDWMQLLVVPFALAAIAFGLSVWQDDRQRRQTAALADRERERVEDRQQDEILGDYLNDMSGLLLRDRLVDSRRDSEVRRVARALTLTALRRLDALRKTALLRFLIESQLVQGPDVRVSLAQADLRGVRLRGLSLNRVDFTDSHLDNVDLRNTWLAETDFSGSQLRNADFRRAKSPDRLTVAFVMSPHDARTLHVQLSPRDVRRRAEFLGAQLAGARFDGAILPGASFVDAHLRGASFRNVIAPRSWFAGAELRAADLSNAYLPSADFAGACVTNALFVKANLRGAIVLGMQGRRTDITSARVDEVRDAKDAYLPDLIAGGTMDQSVLRALRAEPRWVKELGSERRPEDPFAVSRWQHHRRCLAR